jgi:hypothetical protein
MITLNWRIHDTGSSWSFQCLNADGTPADLTDHTAALWITAVGGTTPVIRACTIVSATLGQISYTPIAADVATAGRYRLQVKTTGLTQDVNSYPNTPDFILLVVNPD